MKILSLDVGEKRIGVAKADLSTRIAIPVGFLVVDGSEWQEIARLARLNSTNLFVLGLPRSNNGNETKQTVYVRNFAKILTKKIPGSRIYFQDESLTSVIAEERLKSRKKRYGKGEVDAEAATIILQDFLDGNSISSTKTQEEYGKKKPKTFLRIIVAVAIAVILGLLATGGALWIRNERYKKYAEQFAEIEANNKAEVFNFTILPGETVFDIKKKLAEIGYTAEEIEAGFNSEYDFEFLKNRPTGASLEGYLYGETHEFYKDSTVQDILKVFLKEMGRIIDENDLVNKYAERGLSLFEGITLASIVQKEAPSPEQPTVAQVFLSRLNYGIPLGSDVTVTYALNILDPNREIYTDNQSALKVDSCYNTRLHGGLPCGPISNPGLSALLAVAEPSDTAYLYFLTGDDGLMYYGYTEAEHIQISVVIAKFSVIYRYDKKKKED